MKEYRDACMEFIAWCRPKLGLTGRIHVKLVHDVIQNVTQQSFGYYDPESNQIVIVCGGRHITDVLRTLSHELVHLAQAQISPLTASDGVTGSHIENEANALAGIIMRLWNSRDL
jgi:Zn-dependent peptidase ImmA (M78 family)